MNSDEKMREITSAANPFIKRLKSLASSKKARLESGAFIVEGWRGIDTLLRHNRRRYNLETLVISSEWSNDPRLPSGIDTVVLPAHLLEKVSDVQSAQGILGIIRPSPQPFSVPAAGRFLLLDNLRDPGNLGTLIRSAVGSGFDGILLYGDCVDPFNPKVIRSTMGTFAYTGIWSIGQRELQDLLSMEYELCATTGYEGENLYRARFSNKCILAIGSEAHGLSSGLMQLASRKITIPLREECESLNAAIAGSICMFQMTQAIQS
ncbi:MAG: RNA methyltransferase [Pontiellaceae bacterium]|nr:RNA methyltransferase [Pontiellaceae bacterium]MBN2785398.1 RNA methyltransferase [Pontiellaceae bacterium]